MQQKYRSRRETWRFLFNSYNNNNNKKEAMVILYVDNHYLYKSNCMSLFVCFFDKILFEWLATTACLWCGMTWRGVTWFDSIRFNLAGCWRAFSACLQVDVCRMTEIVWNAKRNSPWKRQSAWHLQLTCHGYTNSSVHNSIKPPPWLRSPLLYPRNGLVH